MLVRELEIVEIPAALELSRRVFMEFDAPDYSKRGIQGVLEFMKDENITDLVKKGEFRVFGSFIGSTLTGMCAMRGYDHVSLLYVDKLYHQMGCAKAMIAQMSFNAKIRGVSELSVNAAPYATEIYHKMGFVDVGRLHEEDHIYFTPMIKTVLDNTAK